MELKVEQDLTLEEYRYLRGTTVWTQITDRQIKKLLENSTFKVRVKADDKTVGMGRVLYDFGYNAFVSDVVVDSSFQGKGIGRLVMETLIQLVKDNAFEGEYLKFNLMAAPGKSGFYETIGFYKRTEENGYGMCMSLNQTK